MSNTYIEWRILAGVISLCASSVLLGMLLSQARIEYPVLWLTSWSETLRPRTYYKYLATLSFKLQNVHWGLYGLSGLGNIVRVLCEGELSWLIDMATMTLLFVCLCVHKINLSDGMEAIINRQYGEYSEIDMARIVAASTVILIGLLLFYISTLLGHVWAEIANEVASYSMLRAEYRKLSMKNSGGDKVADNGDDNDGDDDDNYDDDNDDNITDLKVNTRSSRAKAKSKSQAQAKSKSKAHPKAE